MFIGLIPETQTPHLSKDIELSAYLQIGYNVH